MFFCEGWDSLTWETALSDTVGKTSSGRDTFYPSRVRLPNPKLSSFFFIFFENSDFPYNFWASHFKRGVLRKNCNDSWKWNARFYMLPSWYNTVLKSRRQLSALLYNLSLCILLIESIFFRWNSFMYLFKRAIIGTGRFLQSVCSYFSTVILHHWPE